jgi:threonylcarbamoyladenosine tRNA methylthiotransferase MtaB
MKIYLDTIGCRLNQSEIETYARQFRAMGHILVPDPAEADLAVINTCSVTTAAAADSRKKIRGMNRAGVIKVVVTGCWSTMEPDSAAALTGVSQLIPNAEKERLVTKVLDIPDESHDLEPVVREPIPGARTRTRAFIKIQDGCDNRCTFCITTIARGPGRSRTVTEIIDDIHYALEGGTQEIVLTGVHMGSWGKDFAKPVKISSLIRSILNHTDTPRLRLSSLEPWNIEKDFFSLWQDTRLARHLHLPLQSGCRATLKRMARKTSPEAYARLLVTAREEIPEVAITTDIIVGFPGETESEFKESITFVRKMDFSRGHVFTYSERPGTAAATMPSPVPYPVRKSRSAQMRGVLMDTERSYQNRFIGKKLPVLWESETALGPERWAVSGLTDNYLRVSATTPKQVWNQIELVEITGFNGKGLIGEIKRTKDIISTRGNR